MKLGQDRNQYPGIHIPGSVGTQDQAGRHDTRQQDNQDQQPVIIIVFDQATRKIHPTIRPFQGVYLL